MNRESKQTIHYVCFLFSGYHVQIKKLELRLTVVSVLLKVIFGHGQISLPKIGIPMSKTACIKPLHVYLKGTLSIKIELYWSQIVIRFNIISNFHISVYHVYYQPLYIQIRFYIIT